MTDRDHILEELQKASRGIDALGDPNALCRELFAAYDKGQQESVIELLVARMSALKSEFDRAHVRLLEAMGLSEGEERWETDGN